MIWDVIDNFWDKKMDILEDFFSAEQGFMHGTFE